MLATWLVLAGAVASGLHVVVSLPPYRDPIARLAGPDATVDVLLPTGASPHAFDPTPRDVARLQDADLVVMNGGVDAFVLTLLDGLEGDVPVFVATDALAERGALWESGGASDDDHGDEPANTSNAHADEEDGNPHVWLDPVLMAEVVRAVSGRLVTLAPARAEAIRAAERELVDELHALDEELRQTLASLRGAAFVPFHDAWPHFARRYELDLVLEIEPFPGREPGAGELARKVDAVRASGARAIFNEAQLPARAAHVLAREAGVNVATLDPLGDGGSYGELMRRNARTIAETLTGE